MTCRQSKRTLWSTYKELASDKQNAYKYIGLGTLYSHGTSQNH